MFRIELELDVAPGVLVKAVPDELIPWLRRTFLFRGYELKNASLTYSTDPPKPKR